MRRFFLILTFFLVFQFSAFAQTENPPCPKISITGPAAPDSESPWTYVASVEDSENLKIEYLWDTTAGKIISGQGTSAIEVNVKDLGNRNVTVVVEIKGLPRNCPNAFSETGAVKMNIENCLVGYGKVSRFVESVRLDNEIIQLRRNRNLSIVFHLRFKGKSTSKQIDSRIAGIVRQFAFRKALNNLDRIAFVIVEGEDEEYTTVCYFAKGKEKTYCDDCQVIKGTDFNLSKLRKSKKPKR